MRRYLRRSVRPVNCCAAPSGGFDYSGTTSFDLQAGDVYGFRMLQAKGTAMTQAEMTQLQSLMNKLSRQYDTLTNTVAKYGKTLDQIIGNLR